MRPEDLPEEILAEIEKRYNSSSAVRSALKRLNRPTATYNDLGIYSWEVGSIISEVYHEYLPEMIEEGRISGEVISKILPPVLRNDYEKVARMALQTQNYINQRAGIGLKAVAAEFDSDRAEGLLTRISEAEDYGNIQKEVEDSLINFSQSIADQSLRKNADAHYRAGLEPKIVRIAESGCCKWCSKLAGTYDYHKVSNTGNEVFRRHANCRCVVDYVVDGKRTDVWTKRERYEDVKNNAETREALARKVENMRYKLVIQFFAEEDIKNQESNSLKRAIRKYEKRIAEHMQKIDDPASFYPNWNNLDKREQDGNIRHWQKEIRNFQKNISDRIELLKKRGDWDAD